MKKRAKLGLLEFTNELLKVLDELHEKEHYVKDTEIHAWIIMLISTKTLSKLSFNLKIK